MWWTLAQPALSAGAEHPSAAKNVWFDWFWPPIWSNWAYVVVAGIAALIAVRTLRVIEEQAKISNETLVLTVRPKVIVRSLKSITKIAEDLPTDPIEIVLEVVNRGRSTAYINSSNVRVIIDHRHIPQFMQRTFADASGQNIFQKGHELKPGFEELCGVMLPHGIDDLGSILDFSQGLLTVYVLGYVWYCDMKGNNYKTAFCRRYDHDKRRFVIVRHPDYEYAD
jgi:hypothetical protein